MNNIVVILDAMVCCLWILTYVLILIGTMKYDYPLISPISQLFFGTNEFAVLLYFIGNASDFNAHVIIAYTIWALLEVAIFFAIIKTQGIKKRSITIYVGLIVVISFVLYYLIKVHGCMMFICYFNAFCGVLIWLIYAREKDYPYKWIIFASFVSKLLADSIAIVVNIRNAGIITGALSLMLPLLDVAFIFQFFNRIKIRKRI